MTEMGFLTSKYIYANGQRIARINSSGAVYYYLNDHLGQTRMIVKSNFSVVARYDYWPLGEMWRSWASALGGSEYNFSSKELDEEAGFNLYYLGVCYYDPQIDRWPSVDPG